MNAVADKLREAADYIHAHGWTQGTYADKQTGAVCALGAINRVTDRTSFGADQATYETMGLGATFGGVRYALRKYLGDMPRRTADTGINIAYWNDQPERTQEQVEQAFRDAAKRVDDAEAAAKVLEDAADYIDKCGLHQGGGWTGHNTDHGCRNYCMLGTIAYLITGNEDVYSWDVAKMPPLAAQALGITEVPDGDVADAPALMTREWSRQIGELTRFSDTHDAVAVCNRLRGAAVRIRRDAGITR